VDQRPCCEANSRLAGQEFKKSIVSYLCTSNIILDVRHAWLYECAVSAIRKILELNSDGGDSDSKKCKRGNGGVLSLAGVWSQSVDFVLVVRLAGDMLQSP
jgi:hypothetical protein